MARVRVLLAAEADIEQALAFTLRRFGTLKFADYRARQSPAVASALLAPLLTVRLGPPSEIAASQRAR